MQSRPIIALAAFYLTGGAAAQGGLADEPQKLPTAFEAGWKGREVCEPLYENDMVRAARCVFPPGGGHEKHSHPAHWGYILQGGTMRISSASGDVVRELKSGASWWSDGIAWHEPVNIGQETAIYLIIEPKSGAK